MDDKFRIAIVEDNLALSDIFAKHLIYEGHEVYKAFSGEDLDEYFAKNFAELLILDVNLPGEDGFSIAKRYRDAYPSIYIAMLTIRSGLKDKLSGYEMGADLYLPKPVSAEELSAAVKSIKRRLMESNNQKDIPKLDLVKKKLSYQRIQIQLNSKETILIKSLIEAKDNTLDYWKLLELLGKDDDLDRAYLTLIIHRLNKKLMHLSLIDPAILAVWNTGYQLTQKIQIL